VENKKTRKLISELGVDFAQGHFIGKPVPFEKVLEDLADQARKSTAGIKSRKAATVHFPLDCSRWHIMTTSCNSCHSC